MRRNEQIIAYLLIYFNKNFNVRHETRTNYSLIIIGPARKTK